MPRFAPGARLLHLGVSAGKDLFADKSGLGDLGTAITDHEKRPDVVLHDVNRSWLFLVEAVLSHGPVSPARRVDLQNLPAACRAGVVHAGALIRTTNPSTSRLRVPKLTVDRTARGV